MRRLLLVFMIALLPLRGLVGDAMAVAMTSLPSHERAPSVAMGATPCPDHAAAVQPAHDDPSAHDDAEHQHAVCDLCNGPAMTRALPSDAQATPAHSLHVPPIEHFASSEPHRGSKPPIS
jgi:hypothetical protein